MGDVSFDYLFACQHIDHTENTVSAYTNREYFFGARHLQTRKNGYETHTMSFTFWYIALVTSIFFQ